MCGAAGPMHLGASHEWAVNLRVWDPFCFSPPPASLPMSRAPLRCPQAARQSLMMEEQKRKPSSSCWAPWLCFGEGPSGAWGPAVGGTCCDAWWWWWWAPPCPLQGQPAWEKAQVGESMYFHTLQLSRGSSPIEADQIAPMSKIK